MTISYWHGWTEQWERYVQDVITRFEQVQDEVHVEPVVVSEEQMSKLAAAIAAGNPPEIVTLYSTDQIPALATEQAILPYEAVATPDEMQAMEDWYSPAAWVSGAWNGKIYSTASCFGSYALAWNKGFFGEVGLDPEQGPRSVAELDEWAERLTTFDERGNLSRMGFLPATGDFWTACANFGGRIYDGEQDQITANDPNNVQALEWMVSYSKKYDVTKVQAFESGLAGERAGVLDPLISGHYAMQLIGQWKLGDFRRYAAEGFEFGVIPFPPVQEGDTETGGAGWIWGNYQILPNGAKHSREGFKFAEFWTGSTDLEAAVIIEAWEGMPHGPGGSPKVLEAPAMQKVLEEFPDYQVWFDLIANPRSISSPMIPVAAQYIDRMTAEIDKARFLEKTPQEALDQVQTEIGAEYTKWKQENL